MMAALLVIKATLKSASGTKLIVNVPQAATSDPDGDTLTHRLSDGGGQRQLNIDAGTGTLSFSSAPDVEAYAGLGDANNDPVYEVTVKGTDVNASAKFRMTPYIRRLCPEGMPSGLRSKILYSIKSLQYSK